MTTRPISAFLLRGSLGGRHVSYPLTEGPNRVGSDPRSDVALLSAGVSRRHAHLLVDADRVVLIDDDSKNGTFVNGLGVRRAEVSVGDKIAFGPVNLELARQDPLDAELAIEIAVPEPSIHAFSERESTAEIGTFQDRRASRWLGVVRRFARTLVQRTAGEGAAGALGDLLEELGARGACFFELAAGGPPAVLSAHGELPDELPGELAAAHDSLADSSPGHEGDRCGLFLSLPSGSAWIDRGSGVGLLVVGETSGSGSPAPLLETLVELFGLLGLPGGLADGKPGLQRRLRFPPGYIPAVSPPMTRLYEQIRNLAHADLPVLILGETGVGKEPLARTLHLTSPRRERPFVAINCAAIPGDLMEAELFGIGAGVATGVAARKGRFEAAAGGTLFLDEIGEMPRELQAKLLRVLQENRLHPLGGPAVPIDVQVMAATNMSPSELLDDGRLRRDLYFRLAGLVLEIPPLRHRREDIPPLVAGFVRRFAALHVKAVRGVTAQALASLVDRPWTGNVRELEHAMRRLIHLCPAGQVIDQSLVEELPIATDEPSLGSGDSDERVEGVSEADEVHDLATLERRAIRRALEKADGNQVRAAELLGISRHSLRRRLQKLDLPSSLTRRRARGRGAPSR